MERGLHNSTARTAIMGLLTSAAAVPTQFPASAIAWQSLERPAGAPA